MNAELTNTRKRTRLDRKFDRLRDAEEAGKLGKSKTSRAVRKMLENRLAVIGLVVFAIILISCLLTSPCWLTLCLLSIRHSLLIFRYTLRILPGQTDTYSQL